MTTDYLPPIENLTPRESEVLQYVAAGMSNRQIASELFLALGTVKTHIHNIYGKLGVENRTQATIRAAELQLVGTLGAERLQIVQQIDAEIENPYKGLQAFQEADAEDFFGRDTLIAALVDRLRDDHPWRRFLAVVGPSGSGKSSVVKAGLIPAIRGGALPDSSNWPIVEMLPGSHPLDELEFALTRIALEPVAELMPQLLRDKRGLLRAVRYVRPDEADNVMLVIDQFEEVFTLVEDVERARHFLDLLYTAANTPDSRLWTVITLRADFYDRPLMIPNFSELVSQRTQVVLPMTPDELQRAITGPAGRVGIGVESGLVAAMIADVNEQPGALPLLEYALTELFDRRDNSTLALNSYQAIGGTLGALASRADEVYEGLDARQQAATRQLFLRLITLGEGTEDTRRRALQSELLAVGDGVMPDVMRAFDRSRLLTFDLDLMSKEPTVEVAHEAIIREWGRLRTWLDEGRDDIRQQRLLAAAAVEWERAGRERSYLLRGARLEGVSEWAKTTNLQLTEDERGFLQASRDEHERQQALEAERVAHERALEQRSRQRLRIIIGVLLIASVIGSLLTLGILLQAQATARERDDAQAARATSDVNAEITSRSLDDTQSLLLVSGAEDALEDGDTDLALALVMEALQLDPDSAAARRMAVEVASMGGTRRIFLGHTRRVADIEISPDGRFLVSGSEDDTIIKWDIETARIAWQYDFGIGVNTEGQVVNVVNISPDGQTILAGGVFPGGGSMGLWDMDTGQHIQNILGHAGTLISLDLSPDGRYAISTDFGGIVVLWDTATWTPLHQLDVLGRFATGVGFSPDGRTFFVSSGDLDSLENRLLSMWDVETGQLIRSIRPSGSFMPLAMRERKIAVSPDGRLLVAQTGGSTLGLWDVELGRQIAQLEGIGMEFDRTVFSPDGHRVLSARNNDRSIVMFDVETTGEVVRLYGHRSAISALAFSLDGRYVYSGGGEETDRADNGIREWDPVIGREIQRFDGFAWYSEDGRLLVQSPQVPWLSFTAADVSAASVESVTLHDASRGRMLHRLQLPPGTAPVDYAISPDNRFLAMTLVDIDADLGYITVWNTVSGNMLWQDGQFPQGQYALNFSDDSQILLAGEIQPSIENTRVLRLWDAATGQELQRLGSQRGWVTSSDLSPDGNTVITARDNGTIPLHDRVSGELVGEMVGHGAVVNDVMWLDSGHRAVSASDDRTLILWDVPSREVLYRFVGHEVSVWSMAVSPDERLMVSGDTEGNVLLWNLENGELVHRYAGHSARVCCLQFSPDGQTILTSSLDGTTKVWDVPPYTSIDELLAWLPNNRYIPEFTCDQREEYRITPLCSTDETPIPPPTRTPFPTLTPSMTPSSTSTPDYALTTATPTDTPSVTPTTTPTIPTWTPTPSSTPTLTSTPAAAVEIVPGVPVRATITQDGRDTYQFAGEAGQAAVFDLNAFGLTLTVFDPDGEVLYEGTTGRSDPVVLAVSGMYTIMIEVDLRGGPYTLTLTLE